MRWIWAAVAAVALAAAVAFVALRPGSAVPTRAAPPLPAVEAPFSLRIYAKDAPGRPVRLAADFPAAREATVSVRAELQYFVRPAPKPGEVLLVESTSPQRTQSLRSGKTDNDPVPVGKPFAAGSFGPGSTEVCAAFVPESTTNLTQATKKYCSKLLVTP